MNDYNWEFLKKSMYGKQNSFSPNGMITQLYLWSRILLDNEMEQFTGNCESTIVKKGTYKNIIWRLKKQVLFHEKKSFETDLFFDWDNLDRSGIAENQMSINELSMEKICQYERRVVPVQIGVKLGYVCKGL